jgi:hypothetical protein
VLSSFPLREGDVAGRVAAGLGLLLVVDGVRDLPAGAERDAQRDHVLLREVVDDRPGVVGDDRLVEQLERDVLTDTEDELRPVAAEQLRVAGRGTPSALQA